MRITAYIGEDGIGEKGKRIGREEEKRRVCGVSLEGKLKLATLCSGIGAPEVAAKRLGWECLWSAEVDPQASAVLAHHHPESVNLGDVTKIHGGNIERPDVLVFGSPCQSFSVAGKRAGLDDPRGDITLECLRITGELLPEWVVWENVPGVLSIDGGRTFGAVLGILAKLGYGFAYRVLDAQFFGVPQRRRRVFVTGCLGDWRRAAAVLFERESLRGDSPPSREKGERTAGTIKGGSGERGYPDPSDGNGGGLIAARESGQGYWMEDAVAGTLRAEGEDRPSRPSHMIAHTLTKRYDSSEDGCGRGVPLVAGCLSPGAHPGGFNGQDAYDDKLIVFRKSRRAQSVDDNETWVEGEVANTINQFDVGERDTHAVISFKSGQSEAAGGIFITKDVTPTLQSANNGSTAVPAVAQVQWASGGGQVENPTMQSLRAGAEHNYQFLRTAMSVRRLTPRECCRLQGFPDDYTLIPYKGKPMSDGPRYKMLGNSMAVTVVKWLLNRIAIMECK